LLLGGERRGSTPVEHEGKVDVSGRGEDAVATATRAAPAAVEGGVPVMISGRKKEQISVTLPLRTPPLESARCRA
jgi:hypothetical protein